MLVRFSELSIVAVVVLLMACSAKTDETPSAPAAVDVQAEKTEKKSVLTNEEMDAFRRSRTIDKVFTMAAGSGGRGEIMSELKANGGLLNRPELDIDVYDTSSALTPEELKTHIKESLDRDRVVLIDNGGSPEDRLKAANISMEAIGAQVDAAGAIIQKAPEDKGGGYLLTPVYSKADVQEQVAKGLIPNADAQTNTVEKMFIYHPDPEEAGSSQSGLPK